MSHPHTEPGRHHQGTANNKALLLSVDTLFFHRILSIYTVHKYGTFGEVFCILRFFGLEKEPRRSSQYHVSCRPLRNCCVPTILITTWVRASGSSWPRTPPSHREWPPRSEDVSSIFFSAAASRSRPWCASSHQTKTSLKRLCLPQVTAQRATRTRPTTSCSRCGESAPWASFLTDWVYVLPV